MPTNESHAPRRSLWHDLVERKIRRRSLIASGVAAGAAALPLQLHAAEVSETDDFAAGATAMQQATQLPFTPIKPSNADQLVLPKGYRYDVVAHWGHDLGEGQIMGFNHDWTGFYPIDMLSKGFDLKAV